MSGAAASGIWGRALARLLRDRAGMAALGVVVFYLLVAGAVWLGLAGQGWSAIGADSFAPASAEHWFGTTRNGQDIFARTVYSTRVAFEIGLVVAVSSVVLGAIFGALSGYFAGSALDEVILWLKGVLDAIPFFLFVVAVAYAMQGHPLAMHLAMVATFWTTTSRYVRGEVIKLRSMEFVEAARAVGVSQAAIIFRHVLPNTTHILLVQGTIVFVTAIKAEVILSFLGLGVQDGVSWGLMISQSTNEVTAGFFNNFIAASVAMFVLVMAFNFFSDALQDALDPRKVAE